MRLTRSSIAVIAAVALGGAAACDSIRVARVDYSFMAPLVALPLGLPSPADRRDAFAQVFCKALPLDGPFAHEDCTKYLELDHFVPDSSVLPPLPDEYQVIVVAGIFSACLPRDQVSIFKQGIAQLKSEGLTHIEEVPVSA